MLVRHSTDLRRGVNAEVQRMRQTHGAQAGCQRKQKRDEKIRGADHPKKDNAGAKYGFKKTPGRLCIAAMNRRPGVFLNPYFAPAVSFFG
jgi:hypothetical protein